MTNLIAFTGYAGSGKDEAAKALIARDWHRLAFADAVRDALLALDPFIGWADGEHTDGEWFPRLSDYLKSCGDDWNTAKKHPEVRRLLQRMGTEAGRYVHGLDCWVRYAQTCLVMHRAVGTPVVITDVRFQNEADLICKLGGKVYRISRPGVGPKNQHESEQLDFEVDGELMNDGTVEELHAKVLTLAEAAKEPEPKEPTESEPEAEPCVGCACISNMESVPIDPAIQARVNEIFHRKPKIATPPGLCRDNHSVLKALGPIGILFLGGALVGFVLSLAAR